MNKIIAAGVLSASMFVATGASAAKCTSDVKKDDLTNEQVVGLYDCIEEKLRKGYVKKEGPNTKEYQSWKNTSTQPAATGSHGNRFLMTFVNETGYAEYVKFSEERAKNAMPVGSILAKESFNLSKKGKVKKGPLFFMTKVAAGGDADKFGSWVYTAFSPKGKQMKIKQGFCHGCHKGFEDQDSMGYPDEEFRVSSN